MKEESNEWGKESRKELEELMKVEKKKKWRKNEKREGKRMNGEK